MAKMCLTSFNDYNDDDGDGTQMHDHKCEPDDDVVDVDNYDDGDVGDGDDHDDGDVGGGDDISQ